MEALDLAFVLLFVMAQCMDIGRASVVKMLSSDQVFILYSGQSVELQCEFYMERFNLFDNPILWKKSQRGEETPINIMGNILDPFVATGRFDVTFVRSPPRYRLLLNINDMSLEDYGNYTCEVRGLQTTVMASLTHYIFVRAPVRAITITNNNLTITDRDISRTLTFTENFHSTLRCVSTGGCPPPEMHVYLGQKDVTSQLSLSYTSQLKGLKGLRLIEHQTERWSDRFTVTAADDGQRLKCIVTVPGLGSNISTVKLRINYAPVIKCDPAKAFIGDKNVFIRCEVKSRPGVAALFWIIDVNGTTVSLGDVVNEYWTVNIVNDKGDVVLESRLFMRAANPDSFHPYTLVAENNIGTTTHQVELQRKYKSSSRSSVITGDKSLQVVEPKAGPTGRTKKHQGYNMLTSPAYTPSAHALSLWIAAVVSTSVVLPRR